MGTVFCNKTSVLPESYTTSMSNEFWKFHMSYPDYMSVYMEEEKEGEIILALKLAETIFNCGASLHPLLMVPLTTERKVTLGWIVCYVSFCQFSFIFSPVQKTELFLLIMHFCLLKGSKVHGVISLDRVKPSLSWGRCPNYILEMQANL